LEGLLARRGSTVRKIINGTTKGRRIFFNLPYWSALLTHHNLDVMHIEKNICEVLLATLLEIARKTKDTKKAQLDLQDMGIRKDQHPVLDKGKYKLPSGLYKLSPEMKHILCNFLYEVKLPYGYASNIRRCLDVKGCKVAGLKSQDYHIIFQKLLPLVVRDILHTEVVIPLI